MTLKNHLVTLWLVRVLFSNIRYFRSTSEYFLHFTSEFAGCNFVIVFSFHDSHLHSAANIRKPIIKMTEVHSLNNF